MERKSNDYFVQIEQGFLFDKGKTYKSRFTPWIYLYLKLEYNIFIDKKTSKYVRLKANEIKKLFSIDKSTVYSCVDELYKDGLLSKDKRDSYKIFSEKKRYSRKENSKFIKVFKNQFIGLFETGGTVSEALIYYYMIQHNRHYAFEKELLECDLTQTQLAKILHKDSRDIKNALEFLMNAGFIIKDGKQNKFYTRYFNENFRKAEKAESKMKKIELAPDGENLTEYINYLIVTGIKIQKIGWFKTYSGRNKIRILNIPGYGNVVNNADYIESDNVQPTEQEWAKSLALVKDNIKKTMTTINVLC